MFKLEINCSSTVSTISLVLSSRLFGTKDFKVSGHGTQVKDEDGDEADGLDEGTGSFCLSKTLEIITLYT